MNPAANPGGMTIPRMTLNYFPGVLIINTDLSGSCYEATAQSLMEILAKGNNPMNLSMRNNNIFALEILSLIAWE